jgi:hypothetical protein
MKKTRIAVVIVLTLSLLASIVGASVSEEVLLLTDGRKGVVFKSRFWLLDEKNEWKAAPVGRYVTTKGQVIKVGIEGITTSFQR